MLGIISENYNFNLHFIEKKLLRERFLKSLFFNNNDYIKCTKKNVWTIYKDK